MRKLLLVFAVIVMSCFSYAQHNLKRVSEGKEFWFSIPLINGGRGEVTRGDYPISIWVSSRINTNLIIEDNQNGAQKKYSVRANEITQIAYSDALMMREFETVKNYGIHIKADDPISATVYCSYSLTGEAFRLIPIEYLGTKYVTLNLYKDQTDAVFSPEILIIGTEDNTNVSYIPTAETEFVKVGTKRELILHKGECFLILGKQDQLLCQDDRSDLTGTYIESDKPIAVISGHTKSAFPKLQATYLGRAGNFVRNALLEMMPPIDELGTEFISCPINYVNRTSGIVENDKGDLIRFVATDDSTIIYEMSQDDLSLKQISVTLKKGQWHDIVNQDKACYYKSNKKILVGQFGKAWMNQQVSPVTDKKGDLPLNPSKTGQGMMMLLTPLNHWTSYACWNSPYMIDNFIYLVFRTNQISNIKFDGVDLKTKFGDKIKVIKGTEYSWCAETIIPGKHMVLGDAYIDSNSQYVETTFAVYSYGNWDKTKDGFAYGYPVSYKYDKLSLFDTARLTIKPDTLKFENSTFGSPTSKYFYIHNLNKDFTLSFTQISLLSKSDDLKLYHPGLNFPVTIKPLDSIAIRLDFKPSSNFPVTNYLVIDNEYLKDRSCFIETDRLFPKIEVSDLDFGLQPLNYSKDTTITVKNTGKGILYLEQVEFTNNSVFTFNNNLNFNRDSILPNKSIKYPLSVKVNEKDTTYHCQIIFKSNAADGDSSANLVISSKNIIGIAVSDAKFTSVVPGKTETKTVTVENVGGTVLSLFEITKPKNSSFTVNFSANISRQNPMYLMPNQKVEFTVDFTAPNEYEKSFSDTVVFMSNANYGESLVVITASTLNSVEYGLLSLIEFSPNPATDFIEISVPENNHTLKGVVEKVRIYNVFGQELLDNSQLSIVNSQLDSTPFNSPASVGHLKIDISSLPPGLYFVRVGEKVGKFVKI